MKNREKQTQTLDNISRSYDVFKDFDRHLFAKCGEIIVPRIADRRVLEMGCSQGLITAMLLASARSIDIVEGAELYATEIKNVYKDRVTVYRSLFESFTPPRRYEAIVFTNTLHHIFEPVSLLNRIKGWLEPGGSLHITVPNMLSLHRRIGVKMGILSDVFGDTERNVRFSQPGRYTRESLIQQISECGYIIKDCFGFFLKPFSHTQMEQLDPSQALIDALFEMGKELEELACLIYVEAIYEDDR